MGRRPRLGGRVVHRSRMVVLACAIAALVLGALAPPTAAVLHAHLAIVQGIPGRSVDVCIDGHEVRSKLKYGATTLRGALPGSHALRFRAAGPGVCQGARLGKATLELTAGDDLTIVATQLPPKVVVFDDAGLGIVPEATEP